MGPVPLQSPNAINSQGSNSRLRSILSVTGNIVAKIGRVWWVGPLSLILVLAACTSFDPTGDYPGLAQPAPTPSSNTATQGSPQDESPPQTAVPETAATPNYQSVPGLPSVLIGSDLDSDLTSTSIEPAPDRDLYQLAAELKLHIDPASISRVVNPEPVSYQQGREDTFWLVNFRDLELYQSQFELRLVTPRAYWYVQKGQRILQSDLVQAAKDFEDTIYPQVSAAFGQEWSPGIDNDPHLNIIHAPIQGVAGYFSSSDEHPISVYPNSNQREVIYINSRALKVGGSSYLEVLAHELQHVIHWANDGSEETWVNEGLSDLAVSVAGYRVSNISRFLRSPTTSLVNWPLDNSNVLAHYGGSALFFNYLLEHYGSDEGLIDLVKEPADGIAGIDAYLAKQGFGTTFKQVFGDWVIANVLDQSPGRYGYQELDVQVSIKKTLNGTGKLDSEIPQYAAEYIELTSNRNSVRIKFDAPPVNRLLPTDVGEPGCWWSNSGDSINSTLTRNVDLRGQTQAELTYQVWYQIEEDWDYGYVEISTDGGRFWQILETPITSPRNPVGNSFGPGYTGNRGWTTENLDLSPYAGQEIQVRFQYVTDDAINGIGLCIRNLSLSPAGIDGDDHNGWVPNGFFLINNRVRQDYLVQVIQIDRDNQASVVTLEQDPAHPGTGTLVVDSPQLLNRLLVVVAALAPYTLEPAPYTLTVEPADESGRSLP